MCALLAALALGAAACRSSPAERVEVTNADLRVTALTLRDLAAGFVVVEERFTTNEQMAEDFTEPEAVRRLLDTWRRIAGFQVTFVAADAAEQPHGPLLVSGSLDRYLDVEHARRGWDGAPDLLHYLPPSVHTRTAIDAPRLGDQATALRLYMTDDDGADLVVYWVSFRRGVVVAGVQTVARVSEDDDGERAATLAGLVNARLTARLRPR